MLRWRLFGISFCIEPSFWFMNALWALLMAGPLTHNQIGDRLILIFIALWILCSLVSIMVHELGHVIVGQIFGQPGNITISGLGGQAVGAYDALKPWQRILLIAGGPAAGFGLAALVIAFDATAWNGFMDYLISVTNSPAFEDYKLRTMWVHRTGLAEWSRDQYFPYVMTISVLTFFNLFVNILNLFPIIPMDGGMIFKEICCLVAPQGGLKFAFGVSFALACAMSVFYLELVLEKYGFMAKMIELYYPFGFPEFSLLVFVSMAYQCLQTYRLLAAMERHSLYRDDD
jgi:Zn-dependent protease